MDIKRDYYLNQLVQKQWNGLIKVITGIRRCGKSYLLFNLFKSYLLDNGINENQIIEFQLDRRTHAKYRDPDELCNVVISKISENQKYFVLIDEIQLCDDFESVLNEFLHYSNIDVYVTGSNSKLLSSDIITEFRGRSDEIRLYPFSLTEILPIYDGDFEKAYKDYYTYGGMPQVFVCETENEKIKYLKQLINETYFKDIKERNKIYNDSELVELLNIISSSIGSLTNPLKLSNTFKTIKNINISSASISNYLDYFENAYIISKALRYDVKGKKYIKTPVKYYFVDPGLRNALLNFRQIEEPHLMENIVYNELCRRGYAVDVGVIQVNERTEQGNYVRKQLECDFVINKGNKRYYIQSAYYINSEEKEIQELRPLLNTGDSFKKIIITAENIKNKINEQGIYTISLKEFLLNENAIDC